jgi:dCMP deaminase
MSRPTWDEYWLGFAEQASKRSTCFRNKVGAVIVKDKEIVSTGYNGAPFYQPNCQEIGYCYREKHNIKSGTNLELCRASGAHGEANAITLAAKNGHSTRDSTIYIVGHYFICNNCKAMISNAGIKRVVFRTLDGKILEFFPEKDWTSHPIDSKE